MIWFKVTCSNDLPKDRVFLALWKGAKCLVEYDEEDHLFYLAMMPAQTCGIMRVPQDREMKFTHWADIEWPENYV